MVVTAMASDLSNNGGARRMVNPWVLHVQKMGLKLNCHICLSLFNRPTLLPCDHIFCSSCVPKSSECSICNKPYKDQDLRPAPYMESMVVIYRSLDASFSNMFQSTSFGAVRVLSQVEVAQSSPGCPPYFDDTKRSDDGSSYQGSEHNQENNLGKRLTEQKVDDNVKQFGSRTQDHERDLKRQKRSDASVDIFNSQMQIGPIVSCCAREPIISEPLVPSNTICGFCQSSNLSEDTGEMLHYIHGIQVMGPKANNPDAIHVHTTCIEWAPQVYYVGETVKNLEKELARGAKLKCSKCGLKGAALGCFAKSCRRSYHVQCALKDDCRWELENYLMLCPVHAKQKFPFEKKSKSNQALQIQPLPTLELGSHQSNLCGRLPKETKGVVLCGSALSSAEKLLLLEFAKTFGMAVSKFWRPDVTHVVAAIDADGACTRTLKVLYAILNGKWVLNINWVKACLDANHHVGEEPYEVSTDNYGCFNGPKAGRLRALANEPKLFDGSKFYFLGDFAAGYKRELQNLVSEGGGVVLNTKEQLEAYGRDARGAPSSIRIVYNSDPPQGCQLGEEFSIHWERLNEADDLGAKIGSPVIGHMWILESIASCNLHPLVT